MILSLAAHLTDTNKPLKSQIGPTLQKAQHIEFDRAALGNNQNPSVTLTLNQNISWPLEGTLECLRLSKTGT